MFCFVALVILSILGIFSATNRALAKEALDCVLRRVTLRPCDTGFDQKMKARILGSVITRSEKAARFLNKNFEVLSWAFFILLMASSIWSVRGGYLFYTTGSCNGLNSSSFCVFDPSGANNQVSTNGTCSIQPQTESSLSLDNLDFSDFISMKGSSSDKIFMIGCYHCEYTRKVYPLIHDLVNRYGVNFTFINYPVKETSDYYTRIGECIYQQDAQKFWKFNDLIFSSDLTSIGDEQFLSQMFDQLGVDVVALEKCMDDPQTKELVEHQLKEVEKTGFYGTPTIFINGNAFVGPKPYRVYAIKLKGLFYWLF